MWVKRDKLALTNKTPSLDNRLDNCSPFEHIRLERKSLYYFSFLVENLVLP